MPLSALFLLAPHLTPDTVDALLAAATHKPKAQIEPLLAERFPKPDLPALVQPIRVPHSGRPTVHTGRAERPQDRRSASFYPPRGG